MGLRCAARAGGVRRVWFGECGAVDNGGDALGVVRDVALSLSPHDLSARSAITVRTSTTCDTHHVMTVRPALAPTRNHAFARLRAGDFTNWGITIPRGVGDAYAFETGFATAPLGASISGNITGKSPISVPGWG